MKYIKYIFSIFLLTFLFMSNYSANVELNLLEEKDNYKQGDTIEIVTSLCTTKTNIPTTGDFYIKWDSNKLELLSDYDDIDYVRKNYFIFKDAKLNFFNKTISKNTATANIVYEYTGEKTELKSDTCFNIIKLTFKVLETDVSTIGSIYTEEKHYSSLSCYDTKDKEEIKNCYKVYDSKIPISIIGNDTEGSLTSLIVKDAILGNVLDSFPEFSSDIKTYNYEVDNKVSSIRINSQCLTEGCTINGNGKKSLIVGLNTFTITTKVGNKKTTYKLNITRKGSVDTNLTYVKILDDNNEKINFEFDGKISNSLTVPNSVTHLKFEAECASKNCTIKEINNEELKIGMNKIKLLVIAEDKEKNATYTFYVTRLKEELAFLKDLSIEGYKLNEKFDPNVYEYTVNVKHTVKELDFNYVKSNDNFIVIIDGNTNLQNTSRDITLTVKGTDSNNVTIYRITTIPETRGYIILLYITIPLIIIAFCLVVNLILLRNKKVNEI